jgi:glutathione peroxidase
MKQSLIAVACGLMASGGAVIGLVACSPPGSSAVAVQETAVPDPFVLKYTMNAIDGTPVDLASFKGKVVLMVNTASKCGFTGQYADLEALYKKHKDAGLVILGFPSNDFMGQEPGTNADIAKFCSTEFGVTFPMFEKVTVKGDDAHPLYKQLAAQPDPIGGAPKWNFTKFLVDREGKVVFRSDARMLSRKSLETELVAKVDELLAKRP